jgi:hypothetical protein
MDMVPAMTDLPPPPPGPAEAQQVSRPVQVEVKYPAGAGKAFRVLMIIVAALGALGVLAAINMYIVAGDIRDGATGLDVAQELLDADDGLRGAIALTVLVSIAAAILEIIWTYRMSVHLRSVGRPSRMSNGMAVGGFFIPFGNLIIPWLFKSDFAKQLRRDRPDSQAPSNALVALAWWLRLAFLVGWFSWSSVYNDQDSTIDDVTNAAAFLTVALIVFVAGSVLTVISTRKFDLDSNRLLKSQI